MIKQDTKETIIRRINSLNKRIDLKIVNGKDYTKEANEHSDLRKYLKDYF